MGENFAAGMSGGYEYILGAHNIPRVNTGLVDVRMLSKEDEREIRLWLERHIEQTDSKKAKEILERFNKNDFFKVMPRDYERALRALESCKKEKDPELAAFLELTRA